jgi:hypothetical protein
MNYHQAFCTSSASATTHHQTVAIAMMPIINLSRDGPETLAFCFPALH